MSSKSIADVFLVAENRLLREALVRLLAKKDIRVVGANLYSSAVVDDIARRELDVILLDSTGLLPTPTVLSPIRAAIHRGKVLIFNEMANTNTFPMALPEGVVD